MKKIVLAAAALVVCLGVAGIASSAVDPANGSGCEALGVCERLDRIIAKVNQPPVVNVAPTPPVVVPAPVVNVAAARPPLHIYATGGISGTTCGPGTAPGAGIACQPVALTLCTSLGYTNARITEASNAAIKGVVCY